MDQTKIKLCLVCLLVYANSLPRHCFAHVVVTTQRGLWSCDENNLAQGHVQLRVHRCVCLTSYLYFPFILPTVFKMFPSSEAVPRGKSWWINATKNRSPRYFFLSCLQTGEPKYFRRREFFWPQTRIARTHKTSVLRASLSHCW